MSVFDSVPASIVFYFRAMCGDFLALATQSIVTFDDIQMLHGKINRGNVIMVYSRELPCFSRFFFVFFVYFYIFERARTFREMIANEFEIKA